MKLSSIVFAYCIHETGKIIISFVIFRTRQQKADTCCLCLVLLKASVLVRPKSPSPLVIDALNLSANHALIERIGR